MRVSLETADGITIHMIYQRTIDFLVIILKVYIVCMYVQ